MNVTDKSLLQTIDIDPFDFEGDFGDKTITRGIAYYKRNMVSPLLSISDLKDDGLVIKGQIKGSGHNVYQCELIIVPNMFSTSVSSWCDCPVEIDCKHGVALLFHYLHLKKQPEKKPTPLTDENRIDQWLNFIKNQEDDIKAESFLPPVNYKLGKKAKKTLKQYLAVQA